MTETNEIIGYYEIPALFHLWSFYVLKYLHCLCREVILLFSHLNYLLVNHIIKAHVNCSSLHENYEQFPFNFCNFFFFIKINPEFTGRIC